MKTTLKNLSHAALFAFAAAAASGAHAAPAANEYVRGSVHKLDGDSLQVETATGIVTVKLGQPLVIYASRATDLSHVAKTSFVGITSEKQADGTELAKEIHIFPEALRGMGEGSHMMDDGNGKATSNRMTNGSVAASRTTTGTVQGENGTTLTLNYGDASRPISVPPTVPVTELAPVQGPLTLGQRITAVAQKDASGTLTATQVVLSRPAPKK
jgi:hypothetical protein